MDSKDLRIAELEQQLAMRVDDCRIAIEQRDEARTDACKMAFAANIMMRRIEDRDYPDAVAIQEKYKKTT